MTGLVLNGGLFRLSSCTLRLVLPLAKQIVLLCEHSPKLKSIRYSFCFHNFSFKLQKIMWPKHFLVSDTGHDLLKQLLHVYFVSFYLGI